MSAFPGKAALEGPTRARLLRAVRANDLRGRLGEDLAMADAGPLGLALAAEAQRLGIARLALCYDGRLSSPALAGDLAEGLQTGGLDIVWLGLGPTPLLYFATHELPAVGGGVMVTASHSPADCNGFKIVLAGERLRRRRLTALVEETARALPARSRGQRLDCDPSRAYLDDLALQGLSAAPLRVGWDPGHGATAHLVRRLVERLPGEHHLINAQVDGRFPAHHPDPSRPDNLQDLRRLVLARGLDLGFAFDGDGDRLGLVDGRGRFLWGDDVLLLLAGDLLRRRPGATIVADVKSSRRLFEGVEALGGRAVMCRTGHGYVLEAMAEIDAALGGEVSAHLFFRDRGRGYDDGLLAAVRVLAALGRTGESLADFLDGLPPVANTPTLRIACPEAEKAAVMQAVEASLENAAVERLDGLRVTVPEGWWLLRSSNTEDCLILRCEAADADGLARLRGRVEALLRSLGLPPAEA